jgi:AcrR family transcriptional regulator
MDLLNDVRRVFNRRGFSGTSFRAVAAELGISPGHLHYHFRTKEAALEALFQELVDATEGMFAAGVEPATLPKAWFRLQHEYVFFFRELPAILLRHPNLRRRYRDIAAKRVGQFRQLLAQLSRAGLVVAEPEKDFFERFALLLWHQCNSALSLLPPEESALGQAESMLYTLLFPLLTENGRALLRSAGLA